jgi:hypothetical protein
MGLFLRNKGRAAKQKLGQQKAQIRTGLMAGRHRRGGGTAGGKFTVEGEFQSARTGENARRGCPVKNQLE